MSLVLLTLLLVSYSSADLKQPYDLSHTFNRNTLYWEPDASFNLSVNAQEDPDNGFYSAGSFSAQEHGGTHLDAPYHFNQTGWKVSDIPITRLYAKGVHINVQNKVKDNPDFLLEPNDLEEWEKENGKIPEGCIVLFNFGWAKYYGNRVKYFGNNTKPYRFPGISTKSAEWLANTNKVYGVGVDVPSTDPGVSTTFKNHRIFAKMNIFGLENVALNNNVTLPAAGFSIIALPNKVEGGTGGPVRIVAFL